MEERVSSLLVEQVRKSDCESAIYRMGVEINEGESQVQRESNDLSKATVY